MSTKPWSLILAAAVVLSVTLAAAGTHGWLSNRWGLRPSANLAARRLDRPLPERVGNWVLLGKQPLESSVINILQCSAYLHHQYEHVETGERVRIAVFLGPHGRIAVHTPEVCYSSRDYAIESPRQSVAIEDAAGQAHTLWQISFQSHEAGARPLHVWYAWSTGGAWAASAWPRFDYGGAPYLYKLQLAGPAPDADSKFDPCRDFLEVFLPVLKTHLAEPSATLPDPT
jgi:hypothetical protein